MESTDLLELNIQWRKNGNKTVNKKYISGHSIGVPYERCIMGYCPQVPVFPTGTFII